MLAEKFFLYLETIMSHAADGGPVVVSSAPHIPVSCAAQETGLSGPGAGLPPGPNSSDEKVP
ncbi:hypothetical protein [Bradyrhizobium sp. AUGA SZCCT0431]|uniref:hypothetical protein n=1 Tax=Bradyrhizobium sp. AUGA SZCCT0431 TaxID=2807674 RepID=UPI001BA63C64|nr:hypothetical protein [Bradyrhizobium sp. AUGA SZCCT0431]MBR1146760.1 hypothetical protein [Bradyrhizobium sp. AUGA SZCCT0431]